MKEEGGRRRELAWTLPNPPTRSASEGNQALGKDLVRHHETVPALASARLNNGRSGPIPPIPVPHSEIPNPQSAIRNPQSPSAQIQFAIGRPFRLGWR